MPERYDHTCVYQLRVWQWNSVSAEVCLVMCVWEVKQASELQFFHLIGDECMGNYKLDIFS